MRFRLSTLLICLKHVDVMRLLTALLLLGVLLLASCGQKGPLFLPAHPPPDYRDQPLEAADADKQTRDEPVRQVPDVD